MDEKITLTKYIAAYSGYSRRKAEELIKKKHVSVNGRVKRKPWYELKEGDEVYLHGKLITPTNEKEYFLLNKPAGIITTMSDEAGRPSVAQLIVGASKKRLFPVGRLDRDTTGLLLFTNDGALAQKLSHPRFTIEKVYQVTLDKPLIPEHRTQLLKGVYLPDGRTRFDKLAYAPKKRKFVVIVTIHSGKKRIIRLLFKKLGYNVRQLDRIGYAGLSKRRVAQGKWKKLTEEEIKRLKKSIKAD